MAVPQVVSSLPEGTTLSRFIIAKAAGLDAGLAMASGWKGLPQIEQALRDELALHTKAGTIPGTTTDPAWAAPLTSAGISREFLAVLRGNDVIEQLRPRLRRVPPNVAIPIEQGAGMGGSWIGETAPTPVVQSMFSSVVLAPYKCGTIIVLSRELLKVNPDNELFLRTTLAAGVAAFESNQFLDPSITAIPTVRPASVTNGATQITSSGGTAAQINADLGAMIQAITTPGGQLVWVAQPRTMATIAARLAGIGYSKERGYLFDIPVVVSPASPKQITLLDGDGILFSDLSSSVLIDVSDQGAVEMRTDTTSPVTSATVLVSLWQQNLSAIKALRWLTWQRVIPGSVAWMATTY